MNKISSIILLSVLNLSAFSIETSSTDEPFIELLNYTNQTITISYDSTKIELNKSTELLINCTENDYVYINIYKTSFDTVYSEFVPCSNKVTLLTVPLYK